MTTLEINTQPIFDTAIANQAASISIEAAATAGQFTYPTKASPNVDFRDYLKNAILAPDGVANFLEGFATERQKWEGTELAASRARLYAILTQCYDFYLVLKSSDTAKGVRKQLADGLDMFIKSQGLRTLSKTHDMNKVVKAVFGEDRRRVSAYATALRAALLAGAEVGAKTEHVPADDLISWIETRGGVEEIRLGSKNSGLSLKERAEIVAVAVDSDTPLMTFKPDAKTLPLSADYIDKKLVLVVTYRPTGDLEVNFVVKHDSAVRAALAVVYNENNEQFGDPAIVQINAKSTALAAAINH